MQKYKIDWLSFSVRCYDEEPTNTLDENLLELLGYDFKEFGEGSGKNYYNRGASIGNYVNVYWNDYTDAKNPVRRNSSATMNVVYTGQGSTDLALRNDNDWVKIFSILTTYEPKNKPKPKDDEEDKPAVNITRIDIALDDYDELVKFDDIEQKLKKGHYRSSKRSYNIVKTSDQNGQKLGETIYIGNARTASGSRGNVYARFYDKLAQYKEKNQLVTSDVREHWKKTGKEVWQRYEISFSKNYTNSIVADILNGESIDKIFKISLRNLLEILTPRGKNKNRWYKTKWWEDFLKYDERKGFGLPNRDVMLAETLEWLRVAVLPSLNVLEKIGQERGFDIYDLLRKAKKPVELSKKQNRLIADTRNKSDETINDYLTKFLLGVEIEKERGGK
jgi:phage replication initiation protein